MSFCSTEATSTSGWVGSAAPAELRPQLVKLKAIAATNRAIPISVIRQWRFFFMGSYSQAVASKPPRFASCAKFAQPVESRVEPGLFSATRNRLIVSGEAPRDYYIFQLVECSWSIALRNHVG